MAEKSFPVPDNGSLFAHEEEILKFWQDRKVFDKSVNKNPKDQVFSFYDGPPFITGLPHYGTLLPSIAKDIIPRYQTMKGKYVRRRWGWDVHGLPAENQVEKQLGLKSKRDIEELGIDKFVEACRKYVNTSSNAWQWYIDHIGRWIDMENAYRGDQLSFMESVIWAFKQLYEKDLIYRGQRVSLYCTRCATPLSKFEITMEEGFYKDVADPAITIAFKLDKEEAYLLAWTTTPWTLPANLALAVDQDAEYVKVSDGHRNFIMAHQALERYRDLDLEIIDTFKGEKLVGLSYQPLYQFMPTNKKKDYHIYPAEFVSMEEGTGVVHIAPGFGEDDTKLGEKAGLSLILSVDEVGNFVKEITPWAGQYIKDADQEIINELKKRNLIVKEEKITHSYPHCYRCGTPLIYKSQVSWYLKIDPLREELVKKNKDINWVPKHFGSGRFAYNIDCAPDWSLSRTRYWGTPIPVWETDDGELIVVGSVKEIEEMSGQKITDLHRPKIDEVVLTTKEGKKAHRVKEVLDVWFESASMPFAQDHYPFENKEVFKHHFPADFIVEHTGQLRGWFYYLHVLGVGLMDSVAYKNVAVTGVLAGTDGRKMSKSFGNYPDTKVTLEKYGAEALRLYFMGSPIMAGEDIALNEDDIREQSRLINILHNSFRYFLTYANLHHWQPNDEEVEETIIDRWIKVRLEQFIADYSEALDKFDFQGSTNAIRPFIEDLSTWYIRRSRDRFVAGDMAALKTFHLVLSKFALSVAPTLPFSAEMIFQSIKQENSPESVHLCDYPSSEEIVVAENGELLKMMAEVRQICSLAHRLRAEANHSLRQPLSQLVIKSAGGIKGNEELIELINDETNVKEVTFGAIDKKLSIAEDQGIAVGLNTELTDKLKAEGQLRELIRSLQDNRKKAGLKVGQKAKLRYFTTDLKMKEMIENHLDEIKKQINLSEIEFADPKKSLIEIASLSIFITFEPE